MDTQADKSRYSGRAGAARGLLPLLITGIAVILFSTAGVARMMGWGPNSTDGAGNSLALEDLPEAPATPVAATAQTAPGQVEGEARTRGRCAECGVIVATQKIDASDEDAGFDASGAAATRNPGELRVTAARRYETTIRLADGSSRVISHAGPATWRPGERVIVIDGANRPNR